MEDAGFEQEPEGEEYQHKGNTLTLWGNKDTMNLNNMILTNILQSPYFKNQLFQLKTYHEVIDEIYYKVEHLEPWERGSRRTGGQTGMCGGVRGVGAGGIVSTAFCLLYKLYTIKLTRKQLKGLLDHPDSPYIRALGFMYIRYGLPPQDFWHWFSPYLDDTEEIDVKAGNGCSITIGEMVDQFMTKLDWFSTLFPRIPVPVQKTIDAKMRERRANLAQSTTTGKSLPMTTADNVDDYAANSTSRGGGESRGYHQQPKERDSTGHHHRDRERGRDKDRAEHGRHKSRSRSRDRNRPRRSRSKSFERRRSRDRHRESSFERDLRKERKRQSKHY